MLDKASPTRRLPTFPIASLKHAASSFYENHILISMSSGFDLSDIFYTTGPHYDSASTPGSLRPLSYVPSHLIYIRYHPPPIPPPPRDWRLWPNNPSPILPSADKTHSLAPPAKPKFKLTKQRLQHHDGHRVLGSRRRPLEREGDVSVGHAVVPHPLVRAEEVGGLHDLLDGGRR